MLKAIWQPEEMKRLVEQLQEIYRKDADPGPCTRRRNGSAAVA